jgi:uracil-DNA glycosylase
MERFGVMSKRELMDELIAEIRVYRKCELWSSAKNPVPGMVASAPLSCS